MGASNERRRFVQVFADLPGEYSESTRWKRSRRLGYEPIDPVLLLQYWSGDDLLFVAPHYFATPALAGWLERKQLDCVRLVDIEQVVDADEVSPLTPPEVKRIEVLGVAGVDRVGIAGDASSNVLVVERELYDEMRQDLSLRFARVEDFES